MLFLYSQFLFGYVGSVTDGTPPGIVHMPVTVGAVGESITIFANVTDNVAVAWVRLYYVEIGGCWCGAKIITMKNMEGTETYNATIPGEDVTLVGVQYYVGASDGINSATVPETNPEQNAFQIIANEFPVACLEVDEQRESTTLWINQTALFNASASTDDGDIISYFFDFGDGTNTGWTDFPTVAHKYTSKGVYNATLAVMDNHGFISLNDNSVHVEITVIPEFPSALILPLLLIVTLVAVVLKKIHFKLLFLREERYY